MIEYKKFTEIMNMVCDECTSNEHFFGTWEECVKDAKLANWIVKKIKNTWLHFCSAACEVRWRKKNL